MDSRCRDGSTNTKPADTTGNCSNTAEYVTASATHLDGPGSGPDLGAGSATALGECRVGDVRQVVTRRTAKGRPSIDWPQIRGIRHIPLDASCEARVSAARASARALDLPCLPGCQPLEVPFACEFLIRSHRWLPTRHDDSSWEVSRPFRRLQPALPQRLQRNAARNTGRGFGSSSSSASNECR